MRFNPHAIRLESAKRYELAMRQGVPEVAHESLIAGENDSQFRARLMRAIALKNFGGSFSMARALRGMLEGHDGVERELLEESARVAKEPFDQKRICLPWSYFTRDLQASSANAAGYLIGTSLGEALDVLRPWSVAARAGITVIERLRDNLTQPHTSTKATITWLSDEVTPVTESTPALGQIAFTPKIALGLVEMSHRYLLQGVNAEAFVRRELLRTAATAVDQAIFCGSGVNGQPLGLIATPGVQTQAGAALSYAGVTNMKQLVADQNVMDEDIAFIGTNAVRELLENRERAAGSGFIWDNDRVASRPAFTTTDLPASTLICGGWPEVLLGLWGPGIIVELNPYDPAKFRAGIVQARVLIACDIAFAHPSSFCIAGSVT